MRMLSHTGRCMLAILLFAAVSPLAWGAGLAPASVVEQATKAVCDKRVVLLGELPSHGEVRGFQLKSEIVRRLVRECGFRTLVFEAPVYDFLVLAQQWGEGSATQQQLDDAIGRFWWATELAPWRGWLFEEAEHGRLALRGMDDQVSDTTRLAVEVLPALVASRLPAGAAAPCASTVERYLRWSYDDAHPHDEAEQERLLQCAGDAAASRLPSSSPQKAALESMMLASFASYLARDAELAGARDRDAVMFGNLLLEATGKTIVWTATVHAARTQGARATKPVGTWITERWGTDVAAIGFTALGGTSSRAGSPPKALEPAPADSLEARLLAPASESAFADANRLRELGAIPSRLLGKFQSADWSSYFDGVIVVREERAPTYAVPY
jgi:erythromycin esterase-like protein